MGVIGTDVLAFFTKNVDSGAGLETFRGSTKVLKQKQIS